MRRVLLAVSALVFLGACGGGGGDGATSPTPPPASTGVATVSVALSATQITVGGTATATTELRSAAGAVVTGRAVSWTSSTPTVATVNDAGAVTALAAGATTITATSEGKTGSASLTVIPAPVATVQVTLALPSVIVGTTTTASAVLRDERGAPLTGRVVAWSSSTPGVATVDISGAITTLAVGSTVITATSEGKSATATLTVIPVPVATVTVALGATSIAVGGSTTATAVARSASGATLPGRAVVWSASNPGVATVSATGEVTAVATGTTVVTATSEGQSGSATLTVIPAPVATVQVTLASPSLTLGATTTASVVLRDERGVTLTGRVVTWSSSTPAVATVDNSGAITTLAVGSTVITATSEGKSATATLTVTPVPVATISVALAATPVVVGGTTTATAVLRAGNGATLSGRAVVWSSSVPAIATVSATGVVTAVAAGTTVVTATSEGQSGSATLTVIVPPVATVTVAGVATLAPGAVSGFTATLRDAAGAALSNRAVTWTSSDPNAAAVSASGTVTAITPGTTTITASSEGKSGSATLTVRYAIATVTVVGSGRVKVGDAYTYTAVAKLADGTVVNRPLQWSITEPTRAVVTGAGVVTPLQAGTFTLEVIIDGETWTSSHTAYDWETNSVGGTTFLSLDADLTVANQFGTSAYPRLVVACSDGMFFLWVSMSNMVTANGLVAYSFDSASPISATWRELSPNYETLWHPGPYGLTKGFASLIAASRRFGFAFGEYQSGARATAFRTNGMSARVAPLFTQCPNNAIVAGTPSAGVGTEQPEDAATRVMAEYEAARGMPAARTVSRATAARAASGPGVGDRSELLRQWPVWTAAPTETQQAKRLR